MFAARWGVIFKGQFEQLGVLSVNPVCRVSRHRKPRLFRLEYGHEIRTAMTAKE